MSGQHGVPSTRELVQAVREFLEHELLPDTDGRLRFMTRVAVNVLAIVERELELGPELFAAHDTALERLGFGSDAELCRAIGDGSLDHRLEEVFAVTRADVVARLRVANPRYLREEDQ